MSEISAVLLSWKRVANLPEIIRSLNRWSKIGEILVWNNNPDIRLDLPGALIINAPRNYLGMGRYCFAPLAKHDVIWFQDDDLILEPWQMTRLYEAFCQDRSRIYGCRGRNIIEGHYRRENVYGECDIIVGQSMLFHRSLLTYFFACLTKIPEVKIEDDIVFSLACQRRHFAVDVEPVKEIGWDDEVALWRQPEHFEQRQRMVDLFVKLQAE